MNDLSRRIGLSLVGGAVLLGAYALLYRWGMATFEGEQLSYVRARVVGERLATKARGTLHSDPDSGFVVRETDTLLLAGTRTNVAAFERTYGNDVCRASHCLVTVHHADASTDELRETGVRLRSSVPNLCEGLNLGLGASDLSRSPGKGPADVVSTPGFKRVPPVEPRMTVPDRGKRSTDD